MKISLILHFTYVFKIFQLNFLFPTNHNTPQLTVKNWLICEGLFMGVFKPVSTHGLWLAKKKKTSMERDDISDEIPEGQGSSSCQMTYELSWVCLEISSP